MPSTGTHLAAPRHDLDDNEVVELHWMRTDDVAASADCRVTVPALCGAWFSPDEDLAQDIAAGRSQVRYVSCTACDQLIELARTLPQIA